MNSYLLASGTRIFSLALILSVASINISAEEVFRSGGSTTRIIQHGGNYQNQNQVTQFEDGHRIITRDGNNIDISIQRQARPIPNRIDSEQRFGESRERFEEHDIERRFSYSDTFTSGVATSTSPDTSQLKEFFLQHMIERLRGHSMR